MAQDKLRGRNNWQGAAEKNGKTAEQNLAEVFKQEFQNTNYSIVEHPTNLKHLYETVELSQETLSQIFNPSKEAMNRAMIQGWGLTPDFSIVNRKDPFW